MCRDKKNAISQKRLTTAHILRTQIHASEHWPQMQTAHSQLLQVQRHYPPQSPATVKDQHCAVNRK